MTPKKLDKKIVDMLIERLADEYKAHYTYQAASNWCDNVGYFKAAAYFKKESDDELEHARGIIDFVTKWNVTVQLPPIATPQLEWNTLGDLIEVQYKLEYNLYLAYEETSDQIFANGDVCVFDFLQKYRTIQVDSVAEASDKLNMLQGVEPTKLNYLLLEENLFE